MRVDLTLFNENQLMFKVNKTMVLWRAADLLHRTISYFQRNNETTKYISLDHQFSIENKFEEICNCYSVQVISLARIHGRLHTLPAHIFTVMLILTHGQGWSALMGILSLFRYFGITVWAPYSSHLKVTTL